MGLCLTGGLKWNQGYEIISLIQVVLVFFLLLSLPLWRLKSESGKQEAQGHKGISLKDTVRLPGAKAILAAFFCYCALEATTGLWAGSYLVLYKGVHADTAAKWAALFYLGITMGRFACGFISEFLGDVQMVRLGQLLAGLGVALLLVPSGPTLSLAGLVLIGIGCAPIYPSLLHATPDNFGAEHSQSIMGVQMACAYVGTTLMPPIFGLLAQHSNMGFFPLYLMALIVFMFTMAERMNKIHGRKLYRSTFTQPLQ